MLNLEREQRDPNAFTTMQAEEAIGETVFQATRAAQVQPDKLVRRRGWLTSAHYIPDDAEPADNEIVIRENIPEGTVVGRFALHKKQPFLRIEETFLIIEVIHDHNGSINYRYGPPGLRVRAVNKETVTSPQ